jgi:hypothetical protein
LRRRFMRRMLMCQSRSSIDLSQRLLNRCRSTRRPSPAPMTSTRKLRRRGTSCRKVIIVMVSSRRQLARLEAQYAAFDDAQPNLLVDDAPQRGSGWKSPAS